MAFVFIDPRRHKLRKRRIKKSAESQRVLDALDAYLEGSYQKPMRWLVRFWRDQAAAMTYQELRRIVTDEDEPENLFNTWYQDYSRFLNEKMTPAWESAFMAGANANPILENVQIDNSDVYVREWITGHTGDLITRVTEDQVNAVRYIIAESKTARMGSAETARYIRPVVGLTERQAQANLKHYMSVKEQLQEEHPRTRPENIERKARESAAKYAQKQQMYRAETISRTEIAQAYNQGNDELIKRAMEQGLIPIQKKVWSTAMDGHVCEACEALEGTEIGMDEQFSATVGVNVRRTMTTELPPMHPRCKCAVMYESTGEYVQQPDAAEPTIELVADIPFEETTNLSYRSDYTPDVVPATEYVYQGKTYTVDNKNVILDPSPREKEVAEMLSRFFGEKIELVPKVTGKYNNVPTPDYHVGNEKQRWDLKELTGKSRDAIRNAIHKKKKQADNFVIDITKSKLDRDEIFRQAEVVFSSQNTHFVNRLMIVSDDEILRLLTRK